MIFKRLQQSNARASAILVAEGYAVSIAAHAAVIGAVVYATSTGAPRAPNAEDFSSVTYFVPKDRIKGSRPHQERITYVATDNPGADGGAKDQPQTKVVQRAAPEIGPGLEELASNTAQSPVDEQSAGDDSVMTVLQVDEAAARYDDSAAPPYPPTMLEKKIEGSVAIQYVVDTTGRADTSSVVILSATHDEFAESVRGTLPSMQFRPAMIGERKVRQLVQQMFSFKIDTALVAQQRQNASQQASGAKKP